MGHHNMPLPAATSCAAGDGTVTHSGALLETLGWMRGRVCGDSRELGVCSSVPGSQSGWPGHSIEGRIKPFRPLMNSWQQQEAGEHPYPHCLTQASQAARHVLPLTAGGAEL